MWDSFLIDLGERGGAFDHSLIAFILLAGSIVLNRRTPGWATRLQIIGSIAYTLYWLHLLIFWVVAPQIHQCGFWFPTDTENQLIARPFFLMSYPAFLFPVGFLWYAVGVARKT
jgi:hypothetical protein